MPELTDYSLNHHTTLVSTAALLVNALESYGLDSQPIIDEAGLDTDKVYLPSERISSVKLKKLWELSVHYSQDPCFGLIYAAYIQPAALHGLGFSWLASHTLKEGLIRLIRYQRIIATDLALGSRETPEGFCIYNIVTQKQDPLQFPDASYDSLLASIYKVSQIMMGADIKPVRVSFEHARPDCAQKFEAFFNIPVAFNEKETAIVFDKDDCERTAPAGNPDLTRINDQIVIEYLDRFDREDVVTRTRKYIIDHLPSGIPRQSRIAGDLNMSLRNFQRKLSLAGTSYAELLQQVRHEMACQYLKSPQHQIITIAYLLGYSDPSNFARAFKNWNGQSPHQFRAKEPNPQGGNA